MPIATLLALAGLCVSQSVSGGQPAHARHAMVVSRQADATDAGLAVLQAGGNAIDAAVAVGFALAVTHPVAGNLGGGGFMLIRLADGRSTFIDFRERAPQAATRDMYIGPDGKATEGSRVGYRAAGVPGTVRGLEYAQKKYGKKDWKSLLEPAVTLASRGFPVSWGAAQNLREDAKVLEKFPESKRIFLRDGRLYEQGEIFIQQGLARTLERIRDHGAADFYEGETAHKLAADMKEHGGLITLQDLEKYAVHERSVLKGAYKGYEILTAPPPSSGGAGLLQMLGVLEQTDFTKTGAGSAGTTHWMAEAMRRFFADRSEYMGDPDFFAVPMNKLLSPKYITELRASIDPEKATPSSEIHPGALMLHESTQTTHYSVVDAEGDAVSVTYTLNGGYGSGVTATGLGFLLNNEMDDFAPKPGEANMFGLIQGEANAIEGGKTPLSSMTPTIVLKEGKLFFVTGSPGGPTIINTVLQNIVNVIDFHMSAQEANDQPRIHHQWLPDTLVMERSFSPDTVELLKQRGYPVKIVPAIGDAASILIEADGLQGAADGRGEGVAKGY